VQTPASTAARAFADIADRLAALEATAASSEDFP
jgi:hypothetical protein